MDTIMAEFIAKINDDSSVSNKDETIVVLTGALHFMIMYGLFPKARSINNNYSNIIKDINNFLMETGDKSFRFIH
jgi:hypothetical protein